MIIALHLLGLAFVLWRWSFRTDDRLVATVRWCLAAFVLFLAALCGVAAWVG